MQKKESTAAAGQLPKREKRSYCIGALGQGMIYAVMSSYISDFYLNVMHLSAIFVLLLMLLARVWDAVNDPLMGVVMDRANPKRGKMRTYIYLVPWPVILLTLALFFAPNYYVDAGISQNALMFYAAVTYVAWGMIYTVGDIPFWSLPNAMVADPQARGKLISLGRTTNGVGSAVPMVLFMAIGPLLKSVFGFAEGVRLEQTRYIIIALVVSVLGGLLYFQTALGVRERIALPKAAKQRQPGEPSALSLIFHNKPLLLVVAMGVLSAGRYMLQAAAIHVARYSIGIEGKDVQSSISTVSLIFQVSLAVGMFGAMLLLPVLMDHFRYKQLLIGSCLLGGAAGLAIFLIGYNNIYVLIPLLILCSIPAGVLNNLSYAMVADTLDYMEWSTGYRKTGLGQACQSFVNKLDNALATSAVVLVYIVQKLDVNSMMTANTNVSALSMPASTRGGFFAMVSLVPAISLLLCIIPMFFYDLEGKKKDQITKDLAERRAATAAPQLP
ncbi:MAG: glycoside-pentoside-hexuronide (GPH):cation symporter [Oscillospiraceae bacterium]|jgi:sugar (glycoside-pentoside-hexuronide) transporter|nr:glycoside-pentoside-hexuronide (GPH):cation symporter [Oscillospiraceae bacterium]